MLPITDDDNGFESYTVNTMFCDPIEREKLVKLINKLIPISHLTHMIFILK